MIIRLNVRVFLKVELFSSYRKVASKISCTMLNDLKWALRSKHTHPVGRFCLCVVSLSLFGIFYKIHKGKAITAFF